tara:strand:- start:16 stop:177 length:162 start_codon:yes stop_codon:yes gene_type:complete
LFPSVLVPQFKPATYGKGDDVSLDAGKLPQGRRNKNAPVSIDGQRLVGGYNCA